MKDYFKKFIKTKEDEADNIRAMIKDSEDVNEVRRLGETLTSVLDELESARDQLQKLEDEDNNRNNEGNKDDNARSFNPMGTYGIRNLKPEDNGTGVDSIEYRTAFMNYVTRNIPIPAELRADANTLTTDVASVIPTVIVNRIIEGITACGMILPLVTRTSYAAGVVIPTSSVKPVASWVSEGAGSDRQKKTTGKITFSYYKLRCEISMSMEVGVMAISAFENAFVANVVDAMTVAIEKGILAGTGSGQPTGILNATPTNVITCKGASVGYADLVAMEAALPIEYDATAKYFMTKAQFMSFVGMVDSNGQPIARVDWGFEGKPSRMLLGREVIVHPYADEMGDYIAGIYDFRDYVLNTVYDMGIQKKQSWETEDLLTKAVMSVDGKPVDLSSLVVLQAKA